MIDARVVDSNKFGKLTPAKLEAFERSLKITGNGKLPAPYRKHLLAHNGGVVAGADRAGELSYFFGIHNGPEWARFPAYAEIFNIIRQRGMLPIGTDPGGNFVCLSLADEMRGSVHFWNHERGFGDDAFTRRAPDFPAYLRGLAVLVAVARKRMNVVGKAFDELGDVPVYGPRTILDIAFERGSLRMIKQLVAAGAKIRPDALIEAVRNGAPNTSRFLLERGADVNFQNPDNGFTALMMAASGDHLDIAELLLRHGAKLGPKNHWGKTAEQIAHTAKMKKLLRDEK